MVVLLGDDKVDFDKLKKELSEEKEIVFNAGTHSQLLKLSYEDYEKLVKPTLSQLESCCIF